MMPYPLINGKAAGENILRRRLEMAAVPPLSILLGMTVNGLVAERESR